MDSREACEFHCSHVQVGNPVNVIGGCPGPTQWLPKMSILTPNPKMSILTPNQLQHLKSMMRLFILLKAQGAPYTHPLKYVLIEDNKFQFACKKIFEIAE